MHTKQRPPQNPHKQWEVYTTTNQQQQNHRFRTDSRLSHLGGSNAFNWLQIFAIEYVVVKTQKIV